MSVSLVKIPIAASNAQGARVLIGSIPVEVRSVRVTEPGRVVVIGLTANGAEVSRVFPAGQALAPAPAWRFRADR